MIYLCDKRTVGAKCGENKSVCFRSQILYELCKFILLKIESMRKKDDTSLHTQRDGGQNEWLLRATTPFWVHCDLNFAFLKS
jgi:hypothetical protein